MNRKKKKAIKRGTPFILYNTRITLTKKKSVLFYFQTLLNVKCKITVPYTL